MINEIQATDIQVSCPGCSAKAPSAAKFCMECGTPLKRPVSSVSAVAASVETSTASTAVEKGDVVRPRRLKKISRLKRIRPVRKGNNSQPPLAPLAEQSPQPRMQRLVPRKQPGIVVAAADQNSVDGVIPLDADASGRIGTNDLNQATELLDEWMDLDREAEDAHGAEVSAKTGGESAKASGSSGHATALVSPSESDTSAHMLPTPEVLHDPRLDPTATQSSNVSPPPPPIAMPPAAVPLSAVSQPVVASVPAAVPAGMPPAAAAGQSASPLAESNSSDPGVSRVEIEKPRKAPPVRLPHPTDTGAQIDDLAEAAESGADDSRTPGTDDTQADLARRRQSAALARFRKLAEAEKSKQRARQEPIPDRMPRPLRRSIEKLKEIKPDNPEGMAEQIRHLGQTNSPIAIEHISARLSRKNKSIRQACAEALGQIPHAQSVIALLDLLTDSSSEVVDSATRGLLASGQTNVIPALLHLSVANPRVRTTLRETIPELSDELRRQYVDVFLAEANRDGDVEVAAFALNILALLQGEEFLKAIAEFTTHEHPELRIAAAEALATTGTNHAARHVNTLFRDKVAEVRAAAAVALTKVRNPKSEKLLMAALSDSCARVRMLAARALTEIENDDLAAAARQALAGEKDPATIEYLLEIIGRAGGAGSLATLEKFLKGQDIDLRIRTISTLRRLKLKKSAPLIAPFLTDEHDETRKAAIKTIGLLGDLSVVEVLRKMVSSERSEEFRAAAARALGELRDRNSLDVLAEALHDGRNVRCQALIAMGQIGHESAVPAVVAQLRDQAPEVRYHACNALGEIGELANPAPLKEMLSDREQMVRRAAEAALKKLGLSYRQAKAASAFRKVAASLVPSTLAGAIPGGAGTLVALVAIAVGAGVWFGAGEFIPSSPDFPILNVKAVGISPDGTQVTVSRTGRVLEVWDTATGELQTQFKSRSDGTSILYRKDGNALLLSGGKAMQIDAQKVAESQDEAIKPAAISKVDAFRVAFNKDRSRALVCSKQGNVSLVDLVSGRQLKTFKLKDFNEKCAITMSPDEKLCFIGNPQGRLIIHSIEENKAKGSTEIARLIKAKTKTGVSALAIDESGELLAVGTTAGEVVVVELNGLKVAGTVYQGAGVIPAMQFGQGATLVFVTQQGRLHRARKDFSGSDELKTAFPGKPEQVSFSSDALTAVASFSESKQFLAVSFAQDKVLAQYPVAN